MNLQILAEDRRCCIRNRMFAIPFLPTYVHVFFGIARGREEDAAVSAGQEAVATARFAKVTIAAVAAAAAPAAATVVVMFCADGAAAAAAGAGGGDAVAGADVTRNEGEAVAGSGSAGSPKAAEDRTVGQSLHDKRH